MITMEIFSCISLMWGLAPAIYGITWESIIYAVLIRKIEVWRIFRTRFTNMLQVNSRWHVFPAAKICRVLWIVKGAAGKITRRNSTGWFYGAKLCAIFYNTLYRCGKGNMDITLFTNNFLARFGENQRLPKVQSAEHREHYDGFDVCGGHAPQRVTNLRPFKANSQAKTDAFYTVKCIRGHP